MTTAWAEWELEDEVGPRYRYLPAPASVRPLGSIIPIGGYGRAEIKPHNEANIAAGLRQLAAKRGKTPRVLITYLPVDRSGRPQDEGRPAKLIVLMTTVPRADISAQDLLKEPWSVIGELLPEDFVKMDWANRAFLGIGSEPRVRELFRTAVLVPSRRKIHGGTGGARAGSDVRWNEIAQFYGELSRQARDPFYAELASELTASLR